MVAPKTFGDILEVLEGSSNSKAIAEILGEAAPAILILLEESRPVGAVKEEVFVWRKDGEQTEPSSAEKAVIKELCRKLRLSWQEGSLALRDYARLLGGSTWQMEEKELREFAPIHELRHFWMEEKRSQYGCLAAIIRIADDETHPGYSPCRKVMEDSRFGNTGSRLIKKIETLSDSIARSGMQEFDEQQRELRWAVELTFLYFYSHDCEANLILSLVQLGRSGRLEWSATRRSRVSLLFSLIFVEVLVLESLSTELGPASSESSKRSPLLQHAEVVKQISKQLRSSTSVTLEYAVISLAWATFLRLGKDAFKGEELAADELARLHLDAALSSDVLVILPDVLKKYARGDVDSIENSSERIGAVVGGLLTAFLGAFTPSAFSQRAQLTAFSNLCSTVFYLSPDLCRAVLAAETDLKGRSVGINSIIRKSQAIFPLQVEPFLMLLTALARDKQCAEGVVELLTYTLGSYAESASDRQLEYPLPHTDPSFEDALLDVPFTEAMRGMAVGVIVRNRCGTPVALDYAVLPEDAVGFTSEDMSKIIWHLRWSGWSVLRVLFEDLLTQLRRGARITDLNDLYVASTLVARICRYTSASVREYVVSSCISVESVEDTISLLAEKRTGIGKTERGILLSQFSFCLLQMVRGNPKRGSFVLRRLLLGSSPSVFRAIVTLGGVLAPALSTLLSIALECEGKDAAVHQLMDFVVADILPVWLSTFLGTGNEAESPDSWKFAQTVFQLLCKNVSMKVSCSPTVVQAVASVIGVCGGHNAKKKRSAGFYNALDTALDLLAAILGRQNAALARSDKSVDVNMRTARLDHAAYDLITNFVSVQTLAMIAANSFPSVSQQLPTVAFADDIRATSEMDPILGDNIINGNVVTASILQDKAARCLSLIFNLHKRVSLERRSPVKQAVWPSGNLANSVRRGVSSCIKHRKSFWAIHMVSSSILNEQRGVARALLKPGGRKIRFAEKQKDQLGKDGEEAQKEEDASESDSVVLAAACDVIREGLDQYSIDNKGAARAVNAAVCLLRYGWETYGVLWLKQTFKTLRIWSLLVSLLKDSPSGQSFSPLSAITMPARLPLNASEAMDESEIPSDDLASLVDDAAEWRMAVANVVFALCADAVKAIPVSADLKKESGNKEGGSPGVRLASEIVSGLREVASSRWLAVILSNRIREELREGLQKFTRITVEQYASSKDSSLEFAADNGERFLGGNFLFDLTRLRQLRVNGSKERTAEESHLLQHIAALNIHCSRTEALTKLIAAFAAANVVYRHLASICTDVVQMKPDYIMKLSQQVSTIVSDGPRERSTVGMLTDLASMMAVLNTSQKSTGARPASVEWSLDVSVMRNISAAIKAAYERSLVEDISWRKYVTSLLHCGGLLIPFASKEDSAEFEYSVLDGMRRHFGGNAEILEIAVYALSEASTNYVEYSTQEALSCLAHCSRSSETNTVATAIATVHLLTKLSSDETYPYGARAEILRALGNSFTSSLLITLGDVPSYDRQTLDRNPRHVLLCSLLKLYVLQVEHLREGEPEASPVLQMVSSLSSHVASHSLQIGGDWPMIIDESSSPIVQHVTLARLHEAESASELLWAFAGHANNIGLELPSVLNTLVSAERLFVYQAYRLLRAEPIERFVVPVSDEEVSRASSSAAATAIGAYSTPVKGGSSKGTPPAELARELVGKRYVSVPPSPSMPATPMTAMNTFMTPDSAGGRRGDTAQSFSDEASCTLMRALSNILAAIRRYSATVASALFEPSMILSAERPSLGLLVAILLHTTHELQRGVEGRRRDSLITMSENAMYLTIQQTMRLTLSEQLPPGVREELRKRLNTIINRQRQLVPPLSKGSFIHAPEINDFVSQLK